MHKVKEYKTTLRVLKSSDPEFMLYDGLVTGQRAGFEISQRCPAEYKMILRDCISFGWLKPIATVYEWELTYSRLKND